MLESLSKQNFKLNYDDELFQFTKLLSITITASHRWPFLDWLYLGFLFLSFFFSHTLLLPSFLCLFLQLLWQARFITKESQIRNDLNEIGRQMSKRTNQQNWRTDLSTRNRCAQSFLMSSTFAIKYLMSSYSQWIIKQTTRIRIIFCFAAYECILHVFRSDVIYDECLIHSDKKMEFFRCLVFFFAFVN